MAFVPEAVGKLRTLPKDEGWKTVGMQVLAAQGGDFRATFVAAEVSEACALLDGLVEGGAFVTEVLHASTCISFRQQLPSNLCVPLSCIPDKQLANAAARKRALTAVMQAEAEQKEAEDRLARAGQQDATGKQPQATPRTTAHCLARFWLA